MIIINVKHKYMVGRRKSRLLESGAHQMWLKQISN